jgi:hypothetical protein
MQKNWFATVMLIAFFAMQIPLNNAVFAASPGHTGVFTVGKSQYVLDGQTAAMDVAPVINDGRTLVPVRYLAYALGLTADDIGCMQNDGGAVRSG